MARSRRWPPYRQYIAEHTSACARSLGFSLTVRQSFPCQQPCGPKIEVHVYPGVIMTRNHTRPKGIMSESAHQQNMWTPLELRSQFLCKSF
ncbi:hypothetical protein PoB_003645300 [Plakobranchus ocellatus]|uniref:Uncharacterized protein n=1 Tax=Plakobranchus ocellatus TaxID=259542 RepID=A0AAV4AT13_9GAST|nr:hypothetical protein PoB_003645300 [Plakobranchus ocellatus]